VNTAADWVLGVDFGTVNTAAAIRDPSGRVTELPLSNTVLMPSAVWYTDQQLLVGEDAIRAGSRNPAALEPYPKRRLRTHAMKWNVSPTQRQPYVPDLVATVISNALSRTRQATGGALPGQLVLTYPDIHPTAFTEDSQLRDGLQEAADLLACPSCALMPDSAAVRYFVETEARPTVPALLMMNFGALRCDAVIYTRQDDGSYGAVASRSVDRLGGFALEDRVRNWVRRSLEGSPATESQAPAELLDEPFPGADVRVDFPIRTAIDALAAGPSADIVINGSTDPHVLRLTRDRFEMLSRGYVETAVALTRKMLTFAGEFNNTSSQPIIVLSGAIARNPTIRARIAELGFVADFGDPATIVARGAAYHGAPSSSSRQSAVRPRSQRARDRTAPTPSESDRTPLRTLRAEIALEGRICRRSLEPGREHQLHVYIAPPGGRGRKADEAAIADGDRAVELLVDVRSFDGSIHETASLVLPTFDRNFASTVAVVKFAAGDEGSFLALNITVLYEGRPIQAAVVQAAVRAKPSSRERIRLHHVPLSAPNEPHKDMTTADATLECTPTSLRRVGVTGAVEVPLSAVEEITTVMAEAASKVLFAMGSTATFDQPEVMRMLINLARLGAKLRDTLAELGVADAQTIALVAHRDSPLVPLELAYDGVAPALGARLCACVSDPIVHPATRTSHASQNTVCPYAFWAMNRLIVRTIGGTPAKRPPARPRPAPLSLRPIVYGAAKTADELSPLWEKPTKKLQDALTHHSGGRQSTRVRSWRAWRGALRRATPQLLVVVGDTEMRGGATNLVIGRRSPLPLRRVSVREATANAPVLVLMVCASNMTGDVLGGFPAAFIDKGAAAVIASLTSVGCQATAAAAALVHAMHSNRPLRPTLAAALTEARQQLIARGSPVGLLLVAHGDTDISLIAHAPPTRPGAHEESTPQAKP
jgi:CHAT domain